MRWEQGRAAVDGMLSRGELERVPPGRDHADLLLTHAHQDRSIVSHHGHAHLDHGALKAFVAHLIRAARHQRRNVPFDHWAAVATGTGQVNLVRRLDTV